jgi:hypothetical protein
MAGNPPNKPKLRLKKADTNRLKTETSRHKRQQDEQADKPAAENMPQTVGDQPGETAQISDPMALRDTTTGKLRRISSPDEGATALAPSSPASPQKGKTETVRLKVVRGKKDQKSGGEPTPGPRPPVSLPRPAGDTLNVPPPPGAPKRPKQQIEVKRATSTVRVSPPEQQAQAEQPPEAPEEQEQQAPGPEETQTAAPTPYTKTGTSTIKLQIRKPGDKGGEADAQPRQPGDTGATPAPNKNATATLNIRSGALKSPPGVSPEKTDKDVTATLKIRPGAQPAPPKPAQAPPSDDASKNVTATLKVRPGGKPAGGDEAAAGPASATVKIKPPSQPKPPAAKVSAEAETKIGMEPPEAKPQPGKPRVSLKLRKEADQTKGEDVTLPGITAEAAEEASAEQTVAVPQPEADASSTVAVKPPAEGAPKKKGLKLKTSKESSEPSAELEPEADVAPEEEAEAQPVAQTVAAAGPGAVATLAAIAAAVGLAALTTRLVLDLLAIMK